MAKKELLAELLNQAYEVELAYVAELTDEEKSQEGAVDDWSPKDALAHVAHWKSSRTTEIQAVLQGGESRQIEDFDHENAEIFQKYCDKSWEEILAFAEESQQALARQLAAMSEQELELDFSEGRPIWRVVVDNGYSHPLIHVAGYYQAKGDMQRAGDLTAMLAEPLMRLDDSPTWQGTSRYNLACSYALMGKKEEALAELRQALALTPSIKEWSQQDPDLESIRGEAGYQALYED